MDVLKDDGYMDGRMIDGWWMDYFDYDFYFDFDDDFDYDFDIVFVVLVIILTTMILTILIMILTMILSMMLTMFLNMLLPSQIHQNLFQIQTFLMTCFLFVHQSVFTIFFPNQSKINIENKSNKTIKRACRYPKNPYK